MILRLNLWFSRAVAARQAMLGEVETLAQEAAYGQVLTSPGHLSHPALGAVNPVNKSFESCVFLR